jgi:Amt family ammonium transporter
MSKLFIVISGIILMLGIALGGDVFVEKPQDPSGAVTGATVDVPASTAGSPSATEITDQIGKNKVSINMMWVLVTGFLVMFMQAGFAMVESGLTRAKNAAHTMSMNMMIYPIGMLGYFVCGFAIMFGGLGSLATL